MAKKNTKKKRAADLPGIGEEPGVGQVRIPEVDDAAEAYVKVRDRRMELTKKEVAAKENLITILHSHEKEIGRAPDGAMRYVYDEVSVELTPTGEQLKVKAYVDPGAPE